MARYELERREEELARARAIESTTSDKEAQKRIREATINTGHWARHHTKTYNQHWFEEGRPTPYEPFPEHWKYFDVLFELYDREPICAVEKSRDMMVSWTVVAYFTLQAMMVPAREVVFQSIGDTEAKQLIEYSYHLYDTQERELQNAFPLAPGRRSQDTITWANGSAIWSVASGRDKIRSYHPWGYAQDESGFQPEGRSCIDNALAAGAKKIILTSSANIGWWSEWRRDNLEME